MTSHVDNLESLKILIVEDDPGHAELIRRSIKILDREDRIRITIASTLAEATIRLEEEIWDLVIADLYLPDGKGTDLLPGDRERASCPFIIMSSRGDERTAVDIIKSGAMDYIVKSDATLVDMPNIANRVLREFHYLRDRHAAEEALKESESRFRAIFDNANDGICIIDIRYKTVLLGNRTFCNMLGYSMDDISGLRVTEILPADEEDYVLLQFDRLFRGEISVARDIPLKRKSEAIFFFDITTATVELGGQTHLVGFFRDVSDRKRMEEALFWQSQINAAEADLAAAMLQQESLNEISQLVLDSILGLTDSEGGYVGYIDPRNGNLICPTRIGEIGTTERVVGRKTIFSEFTGFWGRVLERREPLLSNEEQSHRPETDNPLGGIRIERFLSAPAMIGEQLVGQLTVINAIRDYNSRDLAIIQRLAALYALAIQRIRTNEQLHIFRQFAENSGQGFFMAGLDMIITYANPTLAAMLGRNHPAEIIGRSLLDNYPRPIRERLQNDVLPIIRVKGQWIGEMELQTVGGDLLPTIENFFIIRGEAGESTCIAGLTTDIADRKQAEKRLNMLATHDVLTGLPNRLLFQDRMNHAISKARRAHEMLALLFLDLDGFKKVNDRFGHDVGDLLLIETAKIMLGCVRESDTVARLSGDEFVIILEKYRERESIALIARRVLEAMARTNILNGQEIRVTSSIGISIFPEDGDDLRILLKKADRAMYQVKETGKNGFIFATDVTEEGSSEFERVDSDSFKTDSFDSVQAEPE